MDYKIVHMHHNHLHEGYVLQSLASSVSTAENDPIDSLTHQATTKYIDYSFKTHLWYVKKSLNKTIMDIQVPPLAVCKCKATCSDQLMKDGDQAGMSQNVAKRLAVRSIPTQHP